MREKCLRIPSHPAAPPGGRMDARRGEEITGWPSSGSPGSRRDSVSDWRRRVKEQHRPESGILLYARKVWCEAVSYQKDTWTSSAPPAAERNDIHKNQRLHTSSCLMGNKQLTNTLSRSFLADTSVLILVLNTLHLRRSVVKTGLTCASE